jgi:hypothetical protein
MYVGYYIGIYIRQLKTSVHLYLRRQDPQTGIICDFQLSRLSLLVDQREYQNLRLIP